MTSHERIIKIAVIFAFVAVFRGECLKIAISHCNDLNGQLGSFKNDSNVSSSNAPEPCGTESEHCIGGLVNVVHFLHDNEGFETFPTNNILRFSSGNLIGGESGWIAAYSARAVGRNGWRDFGTLVKDHIQPSALAIGMKEFGAGLPRTIDYMNGTGFDKFTIANTCENSEDEKEFCNTIKDPIKKIEVKNDIGEVAFTIGVIGFTNPTVERLSLPGKLKFGKIADKIKSLIADDKSGIKTFIAIGDGNLATAKEIIDAAPKVKLVIYGAGFSNTQNMTKEYPLKYKNSYIATAGRYGYSVGKMVLEIDEANGAISKVVQSQLRVTKRVDDKGQTIPLNPEAAKVKLNSWVTAVNEEMKDIVGHTRVDLEGGEICWRNECNLGNLMTDAVVHCVLKKFNVPFPFPLHSIWHGGAFFEDLIKGVGEGTSNSGKINKFDIHKWLPYHNNVHLVKAFGRDLKRVFSKSASGIDPVKAKEKDWRQFLQVSNGLEVFYTTKGVPNVKQVRIAHDEAGVPKLSNLQENKEYYLAIPTYLYEGRGVYEFISTDKIWTDVRFGDMTTSFVGFDDDCLSEYIRALNQVSVGLEERIFIDSDNGGGGGGGGGDGQPCKGSKTAVTVILTIVFFVIFLAIIYVGYFYVIPRLRSTSQVEYPPNQL